MTHETATSRRTHRRRAARDAGYLEDVPVIGPVAGVAASEVAASPAAALLLVEDDQLLASSLGRALSAYGYEVTIARSVAEALSELARRVPDLVLLDLGLPDGDGDEVCAYLVQHHPRLPIVVVTARNEEVDVVASLANGAVDFVAKPFRLAELVARIRAHLRLVALASGRDHEADPATIVVDDLRIDVASRRVRVGDHELGLRPKEFDVLARLARDAGAVVTREQLIEEVWDENWWGSTKTLDVHINSIRRKLGEPPGESSRITTIRGVGYRLDRRQPAPF
jgi:DNA-binding response OmpR family regulator